MVYNTEFGSPRGHDPNLINYTSLTVKTKAFIYNIGLMTGGQRIVFHLQPA